MTDEEFWACCNPKNWDKETWAGGAMVTVMLVLSYVLINIFY